MSRGIDYGMGTTNIDNETGIRFGVIPIHDLHERAWEDFEADYGPPTCPECGNEMKDYGDVEDDQEYENYNTHSCADYACEECKLIVGSDEAFGDQPCGHYMDGTYRATMDGDDNDIFILKSPYKTRAQFCSPCAPGAVHLRNACDDGEWGYCFGLDMFSKENPCPYDVYSVATGELLHKAGAYE